MVKQIELLNQTDYVLLTAGWLHDFETIKAMTPKTPAMFRPRGVGFSSPEEATAWVASACCRRLTYHRRHENGVGEGALDMGLQTWILGAPERDYAALAPLFDTSPRRDGLRILVHRTPLNYEGRHIAPCWFGGYIGRGKTIRKRMDILSAEARLARGFLQGVLGAYSLGPNAVRRTMNSSGHRVWESDGRPLSH